MPTVTAAEAPVFNTGGATIIGLASPNRGATDTAAWRLHLHADQPSPTHSLDREELFVVLEGAITARFDDREETADAGGALIVPAGEAFSLIAQGADARAICILPVGAKATVGTESFTPPWAA